MSESVEIVDRFGHELMQSGCGSFLRIWWYYIFMRPFRSRHVLSTILRYSGDDIQDLVEKQPGHFCRTGNNLPSFLNRLLPIFACLASSNHVASHREGPDAQTVPRSLALLLLDLDRDHRKLPGRSVSGWLELPFLPEQGGSSVSTST